MAGAVAVRTATFAPKDIADGSDVRLAAVPAYDLDAAVAHLGAAARIRTVSHQDPADNDIAEWDRLHAWLTTTYPETHRAMTRTILPNRTLIYHWAGSDASLPPIILMAHQDVVPVTDGEAAFSLRNQDFSVRSFRSNLVLRWEWRPGSTLTAVWQQDRRASRAEAETAGVSDMLGSLREPGRHDFVVKMSFWAPF